MQRAALPPSFFFLLSGGWYLPLQIERSGTSVSASPSISTESAASLGDLSPTSFFISEATSFCGQRPQLCFVPYNREGTETLPYRLLCFFFRADGIRPYLCLVPYALFLKKRVSHPLATGYRLSANSLNSNLSQTN